MYKKIQRRVFEIIEKGKKDDVASFMFDVLIMSLISLNVASVFIETFQISEKFSLIIKTFEFFSILVFTVEYVLRLWTAPWLYPGASSFAARCRYVISFMALIDLLAILPFYIPFIIPIDLRVLRALRIFRLFRILKFNRYTKAMKSVFAVLRLKSVELISSVFIVVILMLISSALMYSIEGNAQPDAFPNALSGLWWAIATFTTVGYGDIYPVTVGGKILGGVVSLLGIGLVAVPTGIISSGFQELNTQAGNEGLETEDADLIDELESLKRQIDLIEKKIKINSEK